ncbi:unnamed protein product [Nesidiocoris tenuis]|uniref:Uncharacterized protein n=1 Tax=Nesidiocoris tenuis TaxID=355587 RepID=A0A6H5HDZ5_9HEMI|nr:unnamed protein product [Nesidiocoris tenuis]
MSRLCGTWNRFRRISSAERSRHLCASATSSIAGRDRPPTSRLFRNGITCRLINRRRSFAQFAQLRRVVRDRFTRVRRPEI